ncbi:hypothetical protein N8I71_11055 [Roseibacterium sp. SDUM158016]|jgi:hypothetical protein|uniref:hypothetical protein n=1 Tax=Roseicyclus sediminis TaxID=2980997 RepID=UPI0021D060BF|nr:hypothetical protein [Roseibacterium sp. SDUM158016]MCU4653374.1 hypothetical protein [Roseibacterium sp. SDUM158016]
MRRIVLLPLLAALAAVAIVRTVAAFPIDGTYFEECAGEGEGAAGTTQARLAFPELCFDGACCALSNPTRLRGLPEQFLYDGACTAEDGTEFEARIFFGEGPEAGSVVVVLRGLGMTLSSCRAEPPLEDA